MDAPIPRVDAPAGSFNSSQRRCAVAPVASLLAFAIRQILNLYPAHYRQAFAFCHFLYPLHHGRCLRAGCPSLAVWAVRRVYLVSRDACLAGAPDNGVRDVLSARCVEGTNDGA